MQCRTCRRIAALLTLAVSLTCGKFFAQEKDLRNVIGIGAALPDDGDLPALWRSVDAVVFLRIQEAVKSRIRTLDGRESVWTEYRALAHEVFRRYRGQPKTNVDLLHNADGQIPPISPGITGPEYVAFLKWNDAEEVFEPVIMVSVMNGEVKSSRIRELEGGMKLESFLQLLRAMME